MPIKSKSQARLMYAAMNNPKVANKTGVSQQIAKEFIDKTPNSRWKKLKERVK